MITVCRFECGVRVTGHAKYAEHGKDVICAAVSTLMQTLIESVEQLTTDTIEYDISPGTAYIKYGNLSERGRVLVDSFFVGVEMVADEYPDFVRLV